MDRALAVESDHRRLETDAGRSRVEDHGDGVAEVGGDMGCGGRADMARAVGAGRGKRHGG